MTESSSPGPPSPAAMLPDLPATTGERRASGQAARQRARRGGLGHWAEEDREHDALQAILAQNQIRVPDLLALRHQRMAASPWNYYRGAAAVMAGDLAVQPHSGLIVQLCGDAHVLNFGLWATPERNLLFDLRDFDETLPGPFEWDVKRFAASVEVAARENRVKPARAAAAVTAGVEAYCRRMRWYTKQPELDYVIAWAKWRTGDNAGAWQALSMADKNWSGPKELVDRDMMVFAGRTGWLPVEEHLEAHGGARHGRSHDHVQIAGVEAAEDPAVGRVRRGGLRPHRPVARQGPVVEPQLPRGAVEVRLVRQDALGRGEVLGALVADVVFR